MRHDVKNVIGEVWGELSIIGLLPSKKMGKSYYKQVECRCSCGNIRTADYKELKKGKVKSCGCLFKKNNVSTGDVFNYWTVIKETDAYRAKDGNHLRKFLCKCVCGKEKELTLNSISVGNSKSCGCMIQYKSGYKLVDKNSYIPSLDIEKINKRNLGQWKVLKELSKRRREDFSIERILQMQCSCGYIAEREISRVAKSKSCKKCSHSIRKVVFSDEERKLRARIRGRLSGMISRCHYEKNKAYVSYGAKGITVCDEWRFDFKSFYNWCILNTPLGYNLSDLEIDRVDNNKGYFPENCQLITKVENQLKTKYINLTLEDVKFIRSDKFNMDMCKNYNCSERVIKRVRDYEIFKNV